MRKLITFIAVGFIFISIPGIGQKSTIIKDSKGNYTQVRKEGASISTGKTFTDSKGVVYPVMKSSKGKLFVVRVSKKSGKEYKQYLDI